MKPGLFADGDAIALIVPAERLAPVTLPPAPAPSWPGRVALRRIAALLVLLVSGLVVARTIADALDDRLLGMLGATLAMLPLMLLMRALLDDRPRRRPVYRP